MKRDTRKPWGTPTLEAIDIRDTAVKGGQNGESGHVSPCSGNGNSCS